MSLAPHHVTSLGCIPPEVDIYYMFVMVVNVVLGKLNSSFRRDRVYIQYC
jgi:hypothetical protein